MTHGDAWAGLTAVERRVCDSIANAREQLVELTRTLIGFDTTSPRMGGTGSEAALQAYLAERLARSGAVVSCAEPAPSIIAGHRMVPEGFTFAGRPQMVARFDGTGQGRSLLMCGHVDTVSAAPAAQWRYQPFSAVVADGAIHGRGACDMKGGVASMVFAAEALSHCGVRLGGDLIVNTVTDEETTGAGGVYSARSIHADAAIVPEPTGLGVAVACRGSLIGSIHVEGRAGHAGIPPRDQRHGGAVNAIEKMMIVLDAVQQLRASWAAGPAHPFLAASDCLPTMIEGGQWLVSYPASCRVDCHLEYLPEQADAEGYGSLVEADFVRHIRAAAAADPWLREHPPTVSWRPGGVPPARVSVEEPIVTTALGALSALGYARHPAGFDNWHDGATLTVEAGIPAIALGPGDIHQAHAVDESVMIEELVGCAQALAVCALRFCAPDRRSGGPVSANPTAAVNACAHTTSELRS